MDTQEDFLFGALALQAGLMDARRFAEACEQWHFRPKKSFRDVLVEGGWIARADVPHLEYLLKRALDKRRGDTKVLLAEMPSIVRTCLEGLEGHETDTLRGLPAPLQNPGVPPLLPVPADELRYDFLNIHASGGIGRIWVGRDRHLDREVAIKELHPDNTGDAKVAARFLREARLTSQLEHPGIVPVYELTTRPGTNEPIYTMRLVRGRTLTDTVLAYHAARTAGNADPLDFVALLNAFVAVCNAIAYAHSRGVLHRDLKGANVIVGAFGEVIVLDWGLAKRVGQLDDVPAPGAVASANADPTLTMEGEIVGTPAYMSPEQAGGRLDQIDQRTDIYGLGGILYEILAGRAPFVGASTLAVLMMAAHGEPTPPHEFWAEAPSALETVCLKAMAKNPDDRYASVAELAQEVLRWQDVQRRAAEDALRQQTEVLRSILDLIPGVVWTSRPDGSIEYANQFWINYTGMSLEETIGAGWTNAIHADDLERVMQVWTHSLQTGTPAEVEYRLKRATDGAYLWFLARGTPVRDRDGQIVKWFGMLTEIEDQKRGEIALERQNALVHLLHRVTVAAYESPSVEAALQAGIDQVCAYTGWPVGHVYIVADDDPAKLMPTKIWHLDLSTEFDEFVRITEATPLHSGAGLPGRVLATMAPVWIMDVSTDANFPRAKAAVHLGVKGAFGFPITSAGNVVAVLEFFTREPTEPDEVLLAAMAQIGIQLGQVFQRKRGRI